MFKYDGVRVQGAVQHGKKASGMRRASGGLLLRGTSLTYVLDRDLKRRATRNTGCERPSIQVQLLPLTIIVLEFIWTSSGRLLYVSIVIQGKRVPDNVEPYLACEIWLDRSVDIIS
jgi:hypothetical protein